MTHALDLETKDHWWIDICFALGLLALEAIFAIATSSNDGAVPSLLIAACKNCGPGYRSYPGLDGQTIVVLLCGGDKSSQGKDIKRPAAFGRRMEGKSMAPVRDFDDTLKELLHDPEQAVQYLRAALEESNPLALAVAIHDVLKTTRSTPEVDDAETEALCRALAGLKRAGATLDILAR